MILYIIRVFHCSQSASGNFDWSEDSRVGDTVYAYTTYTPGYSYSGILSDFRIFMSTYTTNIIYDHGMAVTGYACNLFVIFKVFDYSMMRKYQLKNTLMANERTHSLPRKNFHATNNDEYIHAVHTCIRTCLSHILLSQTMQPLVSPGCFLSSYDKIWVFILYSSDTITKA